MPRYKDFQEIPAWKIAHEATLRVYKLTKGFPKEELYGLTSQLRRAASSVAANIVEGFYRNTTKELLSFLYNARGSCGEVFYHLILARDLKYISQSDFQSLSNTYRDLGKQLSNWIRSLKRRID
jgi:four helix bundle protein